MFNILAINMSLRPHARGKLIPIGFSYVLSAIQRSGYTFDLIDLDLHPLSPEQLEQEISRKAYDAVLIGCLVTGYKTVKELSFTIKKLLPNTSIIAGNSVASSIPETLLRKTGVDIAVIGEGDETIVVLLDALRDQIPIEAVEGIYFKKDGKVIKNPLRKVIQDINTIPTPNWTIFEVEGYIQSMKHTIPRLLPKDLEVLRPFPVSSARGCVAQCTFCYHIFLGEKYRHKSSEKIVKEMKTMNDKHGINYFMFFF